MIAGAEKEVENCSNREHAGYICNKLALLYGYFQHFQEYSANISKQ